ncbi:cation-transporting P-type ATPase [Candidatus Peregrinibacteria bacterium]|nr:cation-transporting P-type ATPase [Candidatus Peregrinibacteria bacterium]
MAKEKTKIGLTTENAEKLLVEFGPNIIEGKKRTPLLLQFLGQFKDFMVIILIVASVFAYFADEKIDATIIIVIVFINAIIGFLQEFKAEKAIEALKKLLSPKARVVRDGKEMLIEADRLVPGDIIILAEGDKISADAEILESNEIRIDESILTGESVPVEKDTEKNNKLFMGTQIVAGTGKAIVTKTGMRTEFGKIAALTTETKKDKSPLQKELAHIGLFVGKVTIGISAILFLVGVFAQGRAIIDTLLFAVSVAVAAVPEGLPATITVALAIGVQRMAKKNAIVKQLSSVETLGSTTVICSDKTGTLTKNEMTVKEMMIDDYEIAVQGVGYEPEGTFSIHYLHSASPDYFEYQKKDLAYIVSRKPDFYKRFEMFIRAASLCNNARLTNNDGQWRVLGDPTEGALITLAEKAGIPLDGTYEKHKRLFEIPFDSARKRMSVIVQEMETKEITAYVKGAPDTLLPLCSNMSHEQRSKIEKQTELMANRALRTIAIAYKPLSKEIQKKYRKEDIENDLIFLGLVGMIDPPREEVKEAVKLTHKSGIRVFIITGDHGLTAHAIAKELGLAKSYGVNIITGETLNTLSDEKLTKLLAPGQETIFARVSPEHKLRIVQTLKQTGEIVAVTGDGVNDAPALKRADIGVAMGITGTDVSKEAANMVLTDDSFGTIVTAVIEGRTIYENMKKFIYFIFSANIGEVFAVFSTIFLGMPAPLTAVFMLIINTLTDVFPSLALAVEPVERDILERPPRKPDTKIMEWPFIKRCIVNGTWKGLVTMAVFLWGLYASGWRFGQSLDLDSSAYIQASTMAFIILTFIQMVHAFNCRSITLSLFRMKFFENWYLIGAVLFTVVTTIALVQLPFFHQYLKTTAIDLKSWLVLSGISFSILFIEEARKWILRNSIPENHSARISS